MPCVFHHLDFRLLKTSGLMDNCLGITASKIR